HLRDVADLIGQIACHRVDAVSKILPRTGHSADIRLTAELAFGSHLARHARHFRSEGVELIHHGVDGVLELEDLSAYVDCDLARRSTPCAGCCHLRDVADLPGQIACHGVDAVGKILPGTANASDIGLAAQLAFRTHFARHAGDFRRKAVELVHHRIDG